MAYNSTGLPWQIGVLLHQAGNITHPDPAPALLDGSDKSRKIKLLELWQHAAFGYRLESHSRVAYSFFTEKVLH